MKSRFFLLLPVLGALASANVSSSVALAQTKPTGKSVGKPSGKPGMNGQRRPGGRMMAGIAKELNLTDAQKKKFADIFKASDAKRKPIRESSTLTRDEKRTKLRAIRADDMKKMQAVLTPAQRKKLETIMKERRAKMGQMRREQSPGFKPGAKKPA